MKRWARIVIQAILAVALGASSVLALMMYSDYPKPSQGVLEGREIHKWLTTYANEHGGRLPDKLEELQSMNVGMPREFDFTRVREYRGTGKNLHDLPNDYLLMRCQTGRKSELEARVFSGGRVVAKAPEAWKKAEVVE